MTGGGVTFLAVSREQQMVLRFRDFLYLVFLCFIRLSFFFSCDSVVITLRMGYTLHKSDT